MTEEAEMDCTLLMTDDELSNSDFELDLTFDETSLDNIMMLGIDEEEITASNSKELQLNSSFNLIFSMWSPVFDYKNPDAYQDGNILSATATMKSLSSIPPPIPAANKKILHGQHHDSNEFILSPNTVHIPNGSKFFVIKSFNTSDIKSSFLHKVWSSTDLGNKRLNKAFISKKPNQRIFIFFSVNGSGKFCGVAEMISKVENLDEVDSRVNDIWLEKSRWRGKFNIQWIFVKDISNKHFKHLKVPSNGWKPVTNSRDTQELPFDIGVEMIALFRTTYSSSSFLQ